MSLEVSNVEATNVGSDLRRRSLSVQDLPEEDLGGEWEDWDGSQEEMLKPMESIPPTSMAQFTPVATQKSMPALPQSSQSHRIKSGHFQRIETRKKNLERKRKAKYEAWEQAEALHRAELERMAQEAARARLDTLSTILYSLTLTLVQHGFDLGDLLLYAFDPASNLGRFRFDQFWHRPETFSQLMRLWTGRGATETGQKLVKEFSIDLTTWLMKREAQRPTHQGKISETLTGGAPCPSNRGVCPSRAYALSSMRLPTVVSRRRKDKVCSSDMASCTGLMQFLIKIVSIATLSLLQEYNQLNNKFQSLSALFLYASGVSRQGISVISSYGNSTSYSKLISRPTSKASVSTSQGTVVAVKRRQAGTLFNLSQACRQLLRDIAAASPVAVVYDNINVFFRVENVAIGKKDSLESGTCATGFALFKARPEDMKVSDLNVQFENAPGLTLDDLQHTPQEAKLHFDSMIYTILDIIDTYGGPEFQKYQPLLDKIVPISQHKWELHQDRIYPFPTMELDEATIKGNIEICKEIFKELGFDTTAPEFLDFVHLIAGDQLTISRLRSIAKNRIGHESGYESFEWLTPIIGLFHLKMAQTQGMLDVHLGKSNSSRNPTSLLFQNTLLQQKPIPTPTPFRTARDLIQLSQLDPLDPKIPPQRSFDQLRELAERIYRQNASTAEVYRLRKARKSAGDEYTTAGDMVFEDSSLFIRDALEVHAYTAAIKAGDSGRALLSLKLWALAFRANGRSKYAQEMLYLIHNLTHVWPGPLRDIILNNWLTDQLLWRMTRP
ncbi:hypothetical protein RSAG8_04126, partial [Rhizoctonia solani AG-8 WAC10335]